MTERETCAYILETVVMLLAEHQLHHTQSVESESRMSSLFVNLNMVFVQTGHEVKVSCSSKKCPLISAEGLSDTIHTSHIWLYVALYLSCFVSCYTSASHFATHLPSIYSFHAVSDLVTVIFLSLKPVLLGSYCCSTHL